MSTERLLCPIDPIYSNPYFIYEEESYKDSFLFMDEIDSSYIAINNHIISECLRPDHSLDLVRTFTSIHSYLACREWPEYIFKSDLPEMENTIKRIYDNIIKRANYIYDNYYLTFNIHSGEREVSNNVLFHDDVIYTLNNARGKKAYIKINKKDKINEIFYTSDDLSKTQKNSYKLERLVREIVSFFIYVAYKAETISRNASKNLTLKQGYETSQTKMNCLRSFLSLLGLNKNSNELKYFEHLVASLRNNDITVKQDKKKGKKSNVDLSFYDTGFSLYTLTNDSNNLYSTEINMIQLNYTAEKMLLRLCNWFKVIGMSATAEIDSGLGNFDLSYIRRKLGDTFYVVPPEDVSRIKQSFEKLISGYNKVKIVTELIGCPDNAGCPDSILERFFIDKLAGFSGNIDLAKENFVKVKNRLFYVCSCSGDNSAYLYARYVRIAIMYGEFLLHSDIKSCLAFMNTLPRRKTSGASVIGIDRDEVDFVFDKIAEVLGVVYVPDSVFVLESFGFDNVKTEVQSRLKANQKIFVFSTYKTIGSGQNMVYEIPDELKDSLIKVNSRDSINKDFDAIYLDKPTNLLKNSRGGYNGSKLSATEMLECFLEREKLYEMCQISRKELETELNLCFSNSVYTGSGEVTNRWEKSAIINSEIPCFRTYVESVLIQAIGRISRTSNKSHTVYIYADASIVNTTDTSCLDNLLTPECRAFFTFVKQKQTEFNTTVSNTNIFVNDAEKKIMRANSYIARHLAGFEATDGRQVSQETCESWANAREFVLMHPTASEEDLKDNGFAFDTYIRLPEESNQLRFNKKGDFDREKIYFDCDNIPPVYKTVGESSTYLPFLMEYDFLKKGFIEKGYATSFVPNKYIMSPTVFTNIYKGALGEAVGYFYFKHYFKITLEELPPEIYEKFDFIIPDTRIFIDMKNWSPSFNAGTEEEFIEHVMKKKEICHADYVMIINIMNGSFTNWTEYLDKGIILIPALLPMNASDFNKENWPTSVMAKISEVINNAKNKNQ